MKKDQGNRQEKEKASVNDYETKCEEHADTVDSKDDDKETRKTHTPFPLISRVGWKVRCRCNFPGKT